MMFIFSTFAQTDNIHASMDIEQIISRTYPLPPSSMERMKAYMQEVELPKGHHVLRMGKGKKTYSSSNVALRVPTPSLTATTLPSG